MTSTFERLSQLPDIFTATDALLVTNIPRAQFDNYMWRWKTAGLVRSLGKRSDVWFNLVKNPVISHERWETAVRRALPCAISAGHGVLMRHGVSTQMAVTAYLIQPSLKPIAAVEGSQLQMRPRLWMRHLLQAGAIDNSRILPELDSGAVIADLLRYDRESLDTDDIDWDELTQESLAIFDALAADVALDFERPRHQSRIRSQASN